MKRRGLFGAGLGGGHAATVVVLWSVVLWSGALRAPGQTAVLFPVRDLTGQNANWPITVTPLDGPMTYGSNIYYGPPITLYPTNGMAQTNLIGGNYRITFQGYPGALKIFVPFGATNAVSAADPSIQVSGNGLASAIGPTVSNVVAAEVGPMVSNLIAVAVAPVVTNVVAAAVSDLAPTNAPALYGATLAGTTEIAGDVNGGNKSLTNLSSLAAGSITGAHYGNGAGLTGLQASNVVGQGIVSQALVPVWQHPTRPGDTEIAGDAAEASSTISAYGFYEEITNALSFNALRCAVWNTGANPVTLKIWQAASISNFVSYTNIYSWPALYTSTISAANFPMSDTVSTFLLSGPVSIAASNYCIVTFATGDGSAGDANLHTGFWDTDSTGDRHPFIYFLPSTGHLYFSDTPYYAATFELAGQDTDLLTWQIATSEAIAALQGGSLSNLNASALSGVVPDNNLPVNLAGRDALLSWGAKVSKLQNLTNSAVNIAWIGDSWSTWGYITGPLRAALQGLAGNGGVGYWGLHYWAEKPAGVSYSMTNWAFVTLTNTPGITAATATNTSANLWLTSSVTAFDVCYVTCPGGGTFEASVDGGAWMVVPTAAASCGVGWTNVASGLGGPPVHSHRLQLQVLSLGTGGVTIGGVNCYVESAPSVRLHDLGMSGSSSANWLASCLLPGWTNGLAWLAPDMAVILLGVNDKIESISPSAVTTNLAGLIGRLQSVNPSISVLLIAPSDTGITNPAYTSFQYRDALKAFASSNGCGFVDGCAALGNYARATNLALMANYSHVNQDGGLLLANAVYRYLQPASLELTPAAMTIGSLGVGQPVSTVVSGALASLDVLGAASVNGYLVVQNGNWFLLHNTTGSYTWMYYSDSPSRYLWQNNDGGYIWQTYHSGAYSPVLSIENTGLVTVASNLVVGGTVTGSLAGGTNLPVAAIAASGTQDAAHYLAGNGTWAVPGGGSGGSATNAVTVIETNGAALLNGATNLNLLSSSSGLAITGVPTGNRADVSFSLTGSLPSWSTVPTNAFDQANAALQSTQGLATVAFSGSATSLGIGTLADARLSANVALLNGNNAFTGNNSLSSGLKVTGGLTNASLAGATFVGTDSNGKEVSKTLASSDVTGALGYTPPPNTYAGISNAVQFLMATNGGPLASSQVTSALGYTPPTNTAAGINAALGATAVQNATTASYVSTALLTNKVYASSNNTSGGATGQVWAADGNSGGNWRLPAAIVYKNPVAVDDQGSSSASNVIAFTISGGTLGTNHTVRITACGDMWQNSTSTTNLTLALKYGTTVLWQDTAAITTSAYRKPWYFQADLAAVNSTSSQVLNGFWQALSSSGNPTTGEGKIMVNTAPTETASFSGTSSEDSTGDRIFYLIVTWASISANCEFKVMNVVAEQL